MIDLYRKNQQKKTNQQTIDFINIDTSKLKMSFNDKLYSKQWYLVSYLIIIIINKKNDLFRKMKVS